MDGRWEGEGREEERDEKGKKGGHTMTMPRNKDKQTNKQTKRWHVWGHGYKRQYDVTQSAESNMQHVRVCSKASELIGDVQRCAEFSVQGHTLTSRNFKSNVIWHWHSL